MVGKVAQGGRQGLTELAMANGPEGWTSKSRFAIVKREIYFARRERRAKVSYSRFGHNASFLRERPALGQGGS